MIAFGTRSGARFVPIALAVALLSLVAVATWGDTRDARAWTTPVPNVSLLTGSGLDIGRSVAVGPDGSVYVAGVYNSTTLSVTSSAQVVHTVSRAGGGEAFLAKFDAQGEPVWLRSFGGTGSDAAYAVAVDGAGRAVVVGGFSATATFSAASPVVVRTSSGTGDGYVASFDSAGVLQWVTVVGGAGEDIVNGVAVGPGDAIVVTAKVVGDVSVGALTSPATLGDTTTSDGLVAALDASGSARWSVRVAGTGSDAMERVAVGTDGSVVASGEVQGSVSVVANDATEAVTPDLGSSDAIAVKLDRDGNLAAGWARRFGGAGGDGAFGVGIDASGRVSVASTVDGDVTVGSQTVPGGAGSDILITQFDPGGTLRWANRVPDNGSADEPRGLAVGPEGQVVTVGRLGSIPQTHMAVMAHDTAGRLIWGPTLIGTSANQIGQGVVVDAGGSVYATGRFFGGQISQGDASTNLTVSGTSDVLLVKYPALFPPTPASPPPLPAGLEPLTTNPVVTSTTVVATTVAPPINTTTTTVVSNERRFEVSNGVAVLTRPRGATLRLDGFAQVDTWGVELPIGSTVSLTASGLEPGSPVRVELFSTPRLLWSGTTASDGSLDAMVTVPSDVVTGLHTLRVAARDVQGEFSGDLAVNITAPGGRLPETGGERPVLVVLVAGVLAAAGLVMSTRRRWAA